MQGPGLQLTLRVSRVDLRGSGWRRSVGRLTLSVDMALSRVRGTGSTCISALPSLLSGIGLPAAAAHRTHHQFIFIHANLSADCMNVSGSRSTCQGDQ